MRAGDFVPEYIPEGGWETTVTQGTVITPAVVKEALKVADRFAQDFNRWLKKQDIPAIEIGHPTGSSAYHDVDAADKVYGDIDLQIVVPELADTEGLTMSQQQGYWYRLEDQFVQSQKPSYIHPDSEPGHPIFRAGQDSEGDDLWVQVDLMPHTEKLRTWGRFRVTPERGIKGMLNGNMFSVLGEMLTMSIQHSGVQYKLRGQQKMPYISTRKDYELVTLTTDIENFVMDIFQHEAQLQGIRKPQIDPLLKKHPGSNIQDVKIANLVNAVKGFAQSCERNDMFGKGDLAQYSSAQDFLDKFWQLYEAKAQKDINAPKRLKAETPEARARAADDIKKIEAGLDQVHRMFG